MKNNSPDAAGFAEIALLVTRLHETQQGLQKLAGGKLDAVVDTGGHCYLLHEAQERLRISEATQHAAAAMQSAILDALPAHIALLNHEGVIISVNKGWQSFATSNALEGSASGLGLNYLEICQGAGGPCAEGAFEAAMGIRDVLNDVIPQFSMEYPCHSAVDQKWFRLSVSPIGNLCVNARDAMPEGGILRITAENLRVDAQYASMIPGLSQGMHIAIEVSDTGAGIPPEVAERIFDPFFTTKEVGKGTGLGLSTVLGIVKSHGGVIHLETRQGKGTTFRILVPAEEGEEAAIGEPAAPPPDGNDELVLIADDEEYVRNAARVILEAHGYRVLLAADGTEALALYAKHNAAIDAVLTDLTMPFMDGIAVMKALHHLRPGLPLIASTGQEERVRDLKLVGLVTVLKKPYTADLLLRALHAALRASRENASS